MTTEQMLIAAITSLAGAIGYMWRQSEARNLRIEEELQDLRGSIMAEWIENHMHDKDDHRN